MHTLLVHRRRRRRRRTQEGTDEVTHSLAALTAHRGNRWRMRYRSESRERRKQNRRERRRRRRRRRRKKWRQARVFFGVNSAYTINTHTEEH